jgi:hypothetical protein
MVAGGTRPDRAGYFKRPTIVRDATVCSLKIRCCPNTSTAGSRDRDQDAGNAYFVRGPLSVISRPGGAPRHGYPPWKGRSQAIALVAKIGAARPLHYRLPGATTGPPLSSLVSAENLTCAANLAWSQSADPDLSSLSTQLRSTSIKPHPQDVQSCIQGGTAALDHPHFRPPCFDPAAAPSDAAPRTRVESSRVMPNCSTRSSTMPGSRWSVSGRHPWRPRSKFTFR